MIKKTVRLESSGHSALAFWGRSWTLAAWCETRNDFRAFRVDRVKTLDVLKDRFPNEPGRTLKDFIALQQPPYS